MTVTRRSRTARPNLGVLRFVRRRAHPMNVDEAVGETFLAAFRRPLVRRLSFTAAGALAAGLALVAVNGGLPGMGGSGPLSSSEPASWTGTAKSMDVAAARGSAAGK
ncbi:hypothetical protein OG223_16370 [Streptomyces sp. NBC_01478]|uniref:hypothetical protein n=1 Tax=Streptomyces sp. NBC_01478 TaxID=2903882 RepID=UPI002E3744DA|nr:hypothetical protein [Streptomyces sp. NBC_01478]